MIARFEEGAILYGWRKLSVIVNRHARVYSLFVGPLHICKTSVGSVHIAWHKRQLVKFG